MYSSFYSLQVIRISNNFLTLSSLSKVPCEKQMFNSHIIRWFIFKTIFVLLSHIEYSVN